MTAPTKISDIEWELILNAITAAAASFAGAYGAWKISRRAEKRALLVSEIFASNAATGVCATIANTILSLKSQGVSDFLNDYRHSFERYAVVAELASRGRPFEVLEMQMNLQQFSMPYTAVSDLSTAVSEVKHSRNAPMVLASLRSALEQLRDAIDRRNAMVEKMRGLPNVQKEQLYFGLSGPDGTDAHYPDAMTAIGIKTDDSIYFSLLLADVLGLHGQSLALQLGPGAPKVSKLTIGDAFTKYIPPREGYPDFEKQFRAAAPPPKLGIAVRGLRAIHAAAIAFWATLRS